MALHQAIEHCVGDGGITDPGMPVLDGQLAGNDGGFCRGAIVDDFQQVSARCLETNTPSRGCQTPGDPACPEELDIGGQTP